MRLIFFSPYNLPTICFPPSPPPAQYVKLGCDNDDDDGDNVIFHFTTKTNLPTKAPPLPPLLHCWSLYFHFHPQTPVPSLWGPAVLQVEALLSFLSLLRVSPLPSASQATVEHSQGTHSVGKWRDHIILKNLKLDSHWTWLQPHVLVLLFVTLWNCIKFPGSVTSSRQRIQKVKCILQYSTGTNVNMRQELLPMTCK